MCDLLSTTKSKVSVCFFSCVKFSIDVSSFYKYIVATIGSAMTHATPLLYVGTVIIYAVRMNVCCVLGTRRIVAGEWVWV